MEMIFPYFLLMLYVMPLYRSIYAITHEKHTLTRESMRMMGLYMGAYWLSWFLFYASLILFVTLPSFLVLRINVMPNSNPYLLYSFFCTFGVSLFGYVVLAATIFGNPRIASICGTLVYFVSGLLDHMAKQEGMPLLL